MSAPAVPSLFLPYACEALSLKNRIALAPMTRTRALDDGTPTELMGHYYEQRAGAGLLVTEGVAISAQARGFPNVPGIWRHEHVEGWRRIAERVQGHGTRLFMQLWHTGRIAHPLNLGEGLDPIAPSAIHFERTIVTRQGTLPIPAPRAMTREEIDRSVADYARAARHAIVAGCDGIEIHGANGYLPSQFLHQSTNQRTDLYGGSLENRIRFVVDVAKACCAQVGGERVALKVTPFGRFNAATSDDEPQLYEQLLARLAPLGLAYLSVVRPEQARPGDPDVLRFIRPLWPGTLVAAGQFDAASAQEALDDGCADVIAFARDFIANPDLVERMRDGHVLSASVPQSWYGTDERGYTDYPRREATGTAREAS